MDVSSKVSTDSRTIQPGDVFFALEGPHFNGHDFLDEAFQKGVSRFVVSNKEKVSEKLKKEAEVFFVKDTLATYGDWAKSHRQKFKIPAVAITGSSGKTTVKELVAHVLSQRFCVLKNRGTENNLIGVPKTLFQLDETHEVIVLEMGTSRPGEIERLSSIISPQVGVVTQIGLAHLEGLKDLEGVRKEKLALVNQLARGGALVVNAEDPSLGGIQSGTHRVLGVGFRKEVAEVMAEQCWCHEKGSSFRLNGHGLFETPLVGKHNILNCLFAVAVGLQFGLEMPLIQKGLATFRPVPGRLGFREVEGIIFLDDTYNSNPSSFRASLETLKDFKLRERKGVVCGDMLELGPSAESMHREIGRLISEYLFDYVIAAGPLSKFLVEEAVKNGFDASRISHVKDSAEAGKLLRQWAKPGDRVLVKGSRGTRMEKVFECFTTCSTP